MSPDGMARQSGFFHTPAVPAVDSLAILHLKRDSLIPVTLRETANDGYAEGAVTNTRFGSFPHSTLIGAEWGSQVRASRVDTGTRGRKDKVPKAVGPNVQSTPGEADLRDGEPLTKKRKLDEQSLEGSDLPIKKLKHGTSETTQEEETQAVRLPTEAGSGFVHIFPPTPESWTSSLDHRTQVVYTPDYSYVLQRLRVRPGSSIIEAGAGSGSFTHAAARAVFNGYPASDPSQVESQARLGKVYSYEFHEPRVETLRAELHSHGLESIVELTHRDVCTDGFLLPSPPRAEAIFLDLPAPWLALRHLNRNSPDSPLDPEAPVHLCTFSPCIEQVMATVSALRRDGWTDIDMAEVQHHRIDVRRERIGLREEGLRGVNASAASVNEALSRLREDVGGGERKTQTKQQRLDSIKKEAESRKLFKEGRLVHRTEPEVKTHTSYLVFAILPRDWTEQDEREAENRYPVHAIMAGSKGDNSKAESAVK